MSRGEHGEQVGAGWRISDVERTAEPWCRFSGSCYKRGVPLHRCEPANDKPYMDGCPRNEAACAIAQVLTGRPYKLAATVPPKPRRKFAYRRCVDCGVFYMPTNGSQKRCIDCAAEHRRAYQRAYYRAHLEERMEYGHRYYREHKEQKREWNRRYQARRRRGA